MTGMTDSLIADSLIVAIHHGEKVLTLSVGGDSLIGDIKKMIEAKEGIHPKFQQLSFLDALLDDSSNILDLRSQTQTKKRSREGEDKSDDDSHATQPKRKVKIEDFESLPTTDTIIHLNLRPDSGYEMTHMFVGLRTMPQVFEQIAEVKLKNEELYTEIQAAEHFRKLHYCAEYCLNGEGRAASFRVIEKVDIVPAAMIAENFRMDGQLTKVKDYFNDHIIYDVNIVSDLARINHDMFVPVNKFLEVFADGSERMLSVMMDYGVNYCMIYRNLMRLLKVECTDDISRQKELDVHAAQVMTHFDELRERGVAFTPLPMFRESAILVHDRFDPFIKCWLAEKSYPCDQLTLLYRGSVHGNSSSAFHQRCDNKGPTVTLVRCTAGYMFGAYTPEQWTSRGKYCAAVNSFLFSLLNPVGTPPTKYDVVFGDTEALLDSPTCGPSFGSGNDFHIGDKWLNCEFNFPTSFTDSTGRGSETFTGFASFTPAEVEVWQVTGS
jgi:hypothetical protein